MDSGPLHVAKIFNKRGLLFETSVSGKMLLKNYNLIKTVENKYSSIFCNAPCGLTDIFNYKNTFGCYDSLKIQSSKCKNDNFKNMTNNDNQYNVVKISDLSKYYLPDNVPNLFDPSFCDKDSNDWTTNGVPKENNNLPDTCISNNNSITKILNQPYHKILYSLYQ